MLLHKIKTEAKLQKNGQSHATLSRAWGDDNRTASWVASDGHSTNTNSTSVIYLLGEEVLGTTTYEFSESLFDILDFFRNWN